MSELAQYYASIGGKYQEELIRSAVSAQGLTGSGTAARSSRGRRGRKFHCQCVQSEQRFGRHRLSTGSTNFSAVCVGEKPTTFTSFKPAFLPMLSTPFSVMSLRPFG